MVGVGNEYNSYAGLMFRGVENYYFRCSGRGYTDAFSSLQIGPGHCGVVVPDIFLEVLQI